MKLDEAIYREEALAYSFGERYKRGGEPVGDLPKLEAEHQQLAEWLRELKAYREFADWLVKAVLEDDWGESADFYAEVLCRKLTKLGHLKVEDGKYMEVNADE